jgi:hypothetical protein
MLPRAASYNERKLIPVALNGSLPLRRIDKSLPPIPLEFQAPFSPFRVSVPTQGFRMDDKQVDRDESHPSNEHSSCVLSDDTHGDQSHISLRTSPTEEMLARRQKQARKGAKRIQQSTKYRQMAMESLELADHVPLLSPSSFTTDIPFNSPSDATRRLRYGPGLSTEDLARNVRLMSRLAVHQHIDNSPACARIPTKTEVPGDKRAIG